MNYSAEKAKSVSERLEQQAKSIIRRSVLFSFFAGGTIGLIIPFVLAFTKAASPLWGVIFMGMCAFWGAAIGKETGEARAAMIRYYAHSLAALIQIEENTRR